MPQLVVASRFADEELQDYTVHTLALGVDGAQSHRPGMAAVVRRNTGENEDDMRNSIGNWSAIALLCDHRRIRVVQTTPASRSNKMKSRPNRSRMPDTVGTLKKGETVSILEKKSGWLNITAAQRYWLGSHPERAKRVGWRWCSVRDSRGCKRGDRARWNRPGSQHNRRARAGRRGYERGKIQCGGIKEGRRRRGHARRCQTIRRAGRACGARGGLAARARVQWLESRPLIMSKKLSTFV